MKLRIALLSALFLSVAGTAMATPTAGEAPDPDDATLAAAWHLVAAPDDHALPPGTPSQTAQYYPVPCDDFPSPPSPRPFPVPWPFPSPWPGPTDQCIPNPFPF